MTDRRRHNGPGNHPPADPATRLWRHVSKGDGCWLWLGSTDETGYGQIRVEGKLLRVHRLAYELEVGPIAERYEVDHLCRVRNCVRPDHLEAVTLRENRRRANVLRRQVHLARPCKSGRHTIAPGERSCYACQRDRTGPAKRPLDTRQTHASRLLTVASGSERVA